MRAMTNKGNFLVSALILVLGAVFIWCYDHATLPQYVVTLCGLAFAVPAVVSLLGAFVFNRKGSGSALQRMIQIVCGVGGLGMGLIIILFPDEFKPLLVYPFAVLIAVGGLFQIFMLSHRYRPVDYPGWMLVGPILLIVCGVVMLCIPVLKDVANAPLLVLVTGICGVVYGVTGILISILGRTLTPLVRQEKSAKASEGSDVAEAVASEAPASAGVEAEGPADTVGAPAADGTPSSDGGTDNAR